MIPTAYQALYAGIAAWLVFVNPTLHVRYALQPKTAPRPPLPYATVAFTAFDIVVDTRDELIRGLCDSLEVTGGTIGTVYSMTVATVPLTYTRVSGDDGTSTAAALAALAVSVPGVAASNIADVLYIAGGATTTSDPNLTLTINVPFNMTRGRRAAVASIQTFGGDASEYLRKAIAARGQPAVLALLRAYRIGLVAKGGIRNLSQLRDTDIEQRAMIDLAVNYISESDIEPVGLARTATFEITGDDMPDISFSEALT